VSLAASAGGLSRGAAGASCRVSDERIGGGDHGTFSRGS
jgi:hypothetical protein